MSDAPRPPAIDAHATLLKRQSAAYTLALSVCCVMGIVGAARSQGGGNLNHYLDAALTILPLVAGSMAVAGLVAVVAARLGHRPKIPGALAAGLAFALTLPPQTAAVPAAVAMAFGWIAGREVFGESERSFVHPAVLGHVFLTLTWPQALGSASLWLPPEGRATLPWGELLLLQPAGGAIGAASALACLLSALGLLALGRIPWRSLASVPIGMAAGLGLFGRTVVQGSTYTLPAHLLLGSVLFGVIFLATDPNSSPGSNSGRWAHGVLIGFLIILLRLANPENPDGTISAILVASIFAPLLDHAAGRSKWPRWGHA